MKKHTTQTIILILLFISGCLNKNIKNSDFTTEGFLNNNIFQIIINIKPDNKTKGLIEKRESAYFNAMENIQIIAINKIIDYSINFNKNKLNIKSNDKILNLTQHKDEMNIHFKNIYQKGYIAEEFYDEKQNLTLVYRIHEKNIKARIESFTFKLKEKKKKKKEL